MSVAQPAVRFAMLIAAFSLAASLVVAHSQPSPSPSARVYTEEDLKKARGNVESGVVAGLPSPSPRPSGSPDAPSAEEIWRLRASERRRALADAEKKLREAQAALDGLGAVPSATQVPTGQDPLAEHQAAIRAARATLDAARLAVDAARKSLDDLEDEARRKQVPPGWLRER